LRASRHGSRADLSGSETIGVVQRDVPGAFTAHGEAAEDHALVVDLEALLDRRDGFEDVGLPRPVPAGAVDRPKQSS
jgi:hypothetical protein